MSSQDILSIKVFGEYKGGFKVEVKAGGFKVIVDEPEDIGGSNSGPNPVQYLLVSLIGCLAITIAYYSRLRRIKIEELNMEAEGKIDLRGFRGEDHVRPGLSEIVVKVRMKSDADEKKVMELIKEAEEHCPIRDTIVNGCKVTLKIES